MDDSRTTSQGQRTAPSRRAEVSFSYPYTDKHPEWLKEVLRDRLGISADHFAFTITEAPRPADPPRTEARTDPLAELVEGVRKGLRMAEGFLAAMYPPK